MNHQFESSQEAEYQRDHEAWLEDHTRWQNEDREKLSLIEEEAVGLSTQKGRHGHWSKMNSGRAPLQRLAYMHRKRMGISSYLFAALIWGSIGLGFAIYGRRQKAAVPLLGGILLMGISYLISSALYMSLAGIILVAGILWLGRYFG